MGTKQKKHSWNTTGEGHHKITAAEAYHHTRSQCTNSTNKTKRYWGTKNHRKTHPRSHTNKPNQIGKTPTTSTCPGTQQNTNEHEKGKQKRITMYGFTNKNKTQKAKQKYSPCNHGRNQKSCSTPDRNHRITPDINCPQCKSISKEIKITTQIEKP